MKFRIVVKYLLTMLVCMAAASCNKKIVPWEIEHLLKSENVTQLHEFCFADKESELYLAEFHSFNIRDANEFSKMIINDGWTHLNQNERNVLNKLLPSDLSLVDNDPTIKYKEVEGRRFFLILRDEKNSSYCVVAFPKY